MNQNQPKRVPDLRRGVKQKTTLLENILFYFSTACMIVSIIDVVLFLINPKWFIPLLLTVPISLVFFTIAILIFKEKEKGNCDGKDRFIGYGSLLIGATLFLFAITQVIALF